MEEGTATGMWNGKALSYKFSNIEHVTGGPGFDIMLDSSGDDTMQGRAGFDMSVFAEGGNDTIVDFSYDPIDDYDDVILVIDLYEEFDLTRSDVIDAAQSKDGGVLIDLTAYGRGTIFLQNFHIDELGLQNLL